VARPLVAAGKDQHAARGRGMVRILSLNYSVLTLALTYFLSPEERISPITIPFARMTVRTIQLGFSKDAGNVSPSPWGEVPVEGGCSN
jgi:hypothetical protein